MHYDRFCDFEYKSNGVMQTSCDFPDGKIEFFGDYETHQCGIRIHTLEKRDRGLWMCEMEKYYSGFSRRYLGVYPISLISPISDSLYITDTES